MMIRGLNHPVGRDKAIIEESMLFTLLAFGRVVVLGLTGIVHFSMKVHHGVHVLSNHTLIV